MLDNDRYVWLDFIRGISAIAVCAGHLRAAMFVDYSKLATTSAIEKLFYFVTGLGHQSVMVFFVLSGFFVGGSVINRRFRFEFFDYFIARLSRLWVVLIPALIFTAFIDLYISNNSPSLLAGEHHSILGSGPSGNYSASLDTFLANLFFLQGIYSPVFGSNGPLWSLANEFWYYMLFPFLAMIIGYVRIAKVYRVVSVFVIALMAFFIIQSMWEGFIIWFMGSVVFCVYQKKTFSSNYIFACITGALFGLSLIDSKVGVIHSNIPLSSDLFVAIFFSLFVISLKGVNGPKKIFKGIGRISKWLSEISYSLYLFHSPIVMLIYVNFYAGKQVSWGLNELMQYMFWLSILLFGGLVFWWMFERNTSIVRSWVIEQQIRVFARFQKKCFLKNIGKEKRGNNLL